MSPSVSAPVLTQRICPGCNQLRDVSAFGTDNSRPDRRSLYCCSCRARSQRKSRRKHGGKLPSQQRYEEQLGMAEATARLRLRNMLLYRALQRLGTTGCYRCGKPILSYRDLSVEHKLPWRGVSTKLFWDLDNCSFSHKDCNTSKRRKQPLLASSCN